MKTKMAPDVIVLPDDSDKSIRTFKQIIPITIHHFYIIDEIAEPDRYLDLINTLKTSEEHDTIFIYLNTPGGYLNTAIQIISAMKQSNANIITSIEGEVCSAGTLIFLSGDKYIVNANSTFMIHNYSAWIGGKGNEIAARAKYCEDYALELMNGFYKDFLTDEEIRDVIAGKDIWLSSTSVVDRLGAKEKLLKKDADINHAVSKLPEMLNQLLDEEFSDKTVKTKPKKIKAKKPVAKKKPLKKGKK